MSYILDALKKSELERAQKSQHSSGLANSQDQIQPPAAQVQSQPDDADQPETSWTIKLVYTGLAILSILVLFKIFEVPQETVYLAEVEDVVEKDVPVYNPRAKSTRDSSIINSQEYTNMSVTAIDDAVLSKTDIKNAAIAIEQAPKEILNQLPIMNISSHIYSTQANRRSIVVNDQRLVEGDFVSPGVQVQQITNQGMIVQAQGRLLVVSRSRGWGL